MKQSIYKQLLMLAILLFAGVGNAFAGTEDITVTWDYDDEVKVYFQEVADGSLIGDKIYAASGTKFGLTNNKDYRMYVELTDEYALVSIGDEVEGNINNRIGEYDENGYITFGNYVQEHSIELTIKKLTIVTVNYNPKHVWFYTWGDGETKMLSDENGVRKYAIEPNQNQYFGVGFMSQARLAYYLSSIKVGEVEKIQDPEAKPHDNNFYFEVGEDAETITIETTADGAVKTLVIDENEFLYWEDGNPNQLSKGYVNLLDRGESGNDRLESTSTNYSIDVLKGHYVRMRVDASTGWRVTKVIIDGSEAEADGNGYYSLLMDQDHSLNVEFEEATTYSITVTNNDNCIGFIDDQGRYDTHCPGADPIVFNEGTTVTMNFNATMEHLNESYIDGETGEEVVVPPYLNKVTTFKVDDATVTNPTIENGNYQYVFDNLSADHSVEIEYTKVETNTVTVNYPDDLLDGVTISGSWIHNDDWNQGIHLFEKEAELSLVIPKRYYYEWNEIYEVSSVTIAKAGADPVVLDAQFNEQSGENTYTIAATAFDASYNNSTLTITYEKCPTIIVNMNASINDVWYDSDNTVPFTKNTDVTVVLYPEEGYKITSIKYTVEGSDDEIDIDRDENGRIIFENLAESINVKVETEWVGRKYIDIQFDATSPKGKTYFKTATDKWEGTGGEFTYGSDVTVYIEPTPGYEVKNIYLHIDEAWEWNGELGEDVKVVDEFDDYVQAQYDATTDSYYYVISNIRSWTQLTICTQKKAYPEGLEYVSYTLADLGDGTGEGTFCSEYDLDFKDVEGITAYIASGFNPDGNIVLTKVWDVPRGTGVMIRGISGTYQIPVTISNYYFKNLLVGITKDLDPLPITERIYGVEHTNFTLKQVGNEPRALFYKSTGQKLKGHKAYLQLPTYMVPEDVSGTRGIGYEFDDDATAIKDLMIYEDTESGDYYNLQGQKVQNPGKGIYIKNGKKVIIR